MSGIRKITGDDRASQIAEAALVLPIVFMMLLGIYWFGRAFNIYATINHAAREACRVGVAQTCATCGNVHLSPTPTGDNIVKQALQASGVDPSQIRVYAPPSPPLCPNPPPGSGCTTTGSKITFCNYVQLTPYFTAAPPACGVIVSFQYPYQFWLPFTSLNMQQIILTADVQMKGEY